MFSPAIGVAFFGASAAVVAKCPVENEFAAVFAFDKMVVPIVGYCGESNAEDHR